MTTSEPALPLWRRRGPAARRAARSPRMVERLSAYPDAAIDSVVARVGPAWPGPWPELDGVLAVLFTSRSGSTFLSREIEHAFAVGVMGETLNPPHVAGRKAREIVAESEGGWFAFKGNGSAIIAAELLGFFDAYLTRTRFIRLLRRDIVAQAVSHDKAVQTGQFGGRGRSRVQAVYDGPQIARTVRAVAGGVERLAGWQEKTGRPCRTVVYEDYAAGDLSSVMDLCAALGLPRRASPHDAYRPVERVGNAQNQEWVERFVREADGEMRGLIDRWSAMIEAARDGGGP